MLELHDISLFSGRAPNESWLLRGVSAQFPPGSLCAVVGPSGCGKSTLLKVIAGLRPPDEGRVHWEGRNLDEHDLGAHEIGYVPQFSIAFDLLTVGESLENALQLRVGGLSDDERETRAAKLLSEVGLAEIAERRVGVLSGGQKRRLALALEMVSEPVLLLCDEVTSGLDPQSEDEVVALLRTIAREGRTVLSVTHSVRHLAAHDSVAVLYAGQLIYQGDPARLTAFFEIENVEDLFRALGRRSAEEWQQLWADFAASLGNRNASAELDLTSEPAEFQRPGSFAQFLTLLHRRWRLFLRDRAQIVLQLALLFGFPCLVVIFAWDGLPQIQNLTANSSNAVERILENAAFTLQSSRVGSLVSGLVMFQVVLLTLMGSNNAAREIAGERAIFEKEKFSGLRPLSYIASKAAFLAVLIAAQSIWMGVFVNVICRFPGDLVPQLAVLTLTNAAMTFVCLAISSLTHSAERASLICVYLVGFQLPLSGAVLALPRIIGELSRPFIAAFWGWSGFLQTMRETRFYDVVRSMSQTELAAIELCCWVLLMHVLGGLVVAYLGAKHSRWE
jgi:ABC-type multidrug transport system ATPase subunit